MPISETDALAAHAAIHSDKTSVKLPSGEILKVTKAKNGCRSIKFPDFQAMEQNKSKSSEWAKKAESGVAITWFLSGKSPATWGRVVDGKVDACGKAIAEAPASPAPKRTATKAAMAAAAEAAPAPKRAAAKAAAAKVALDAKRGVAKAKARSRDAPAGIGSASAEAAAPSPAAPKKRPGPAPKVPEAKKQKLEEKLEETPAGLADDPLLLAPLFAGMGHGATWIKILKPVLEGLENAPSFVGPSRDKKVIPVRELTFQALKPNAPSGWRVVSLGQSPYPRIESATGIAHFDNAITSWDSSKFGAIVTMRSLNAIHGFFLQ